MVANATPLWTPFGLLRALLGSPGAHMSNSRCAPCHARMIVNLISLLEKKQCYLYTFSFAHLKGHSSLTLRNSNAQLDQVFSYLTIHIQKVYEIFLYL